jgi:hypothetical protein
MANRAQRRVIAACEIAKKHPADTGNSWPMFGHVAEGKGKVAEIKKGLTLR